MWWLIERLHEASTYKGITILLGVFGIAIDPNSIQEIGIGCVSLYGAIETIRKG